MEVKQNKLPKSQIELEFELTAEEFGEHFLHAIEHLKSHVKVDGFRPGQAPAKMVEDKLKPEALLMEAGDHAVKHVYSEYILESKLEPVGQPEVQIIKIAKGSPFIFKATITVLPDVVLPDYKEIASKLKAKEISVTDEEVQDALNYLQKSRAKMTPKNPSDLTGQALRGDFVEILYQNKDINEGKEVQDQFVLGEGGFMKGFEENIEGLKAGEVKDFSIEKFSSPFKLTLKSVHKMELPEINDEFAKQLGAFETLTDLKTNIKEGITEEKKEEEKQKNRAEILEKIAEKASFEMPEAMVEYEKQRLLEDLKNRITNNMKITFEQYLAAVKQTEDQLKETFQKEAEKRLKGFLVLRELGKAEDIKIPDELVEEEVTKSIKNYSKEQLEKIDIEQLKEYTKGILYNEKVFKKLEECQ